jgi:hypothetical protein
MGTGGGGELPIIEENEERDEWERKNRVDVGSEDCGDDERLGRRGCPLTLWPRGETWVPGSTQAAVPLPPSLSSPGPPSTPPELPDGIRTSNVVRGGRWGNCFGTTGTGGGASLAI